MNDSGGFIRNNLNQFAFIYRLVDIFVIQICLISIAYIYLGRFDVKYFVLGLLSNMAYLFFAELFVLYRSWRSGSFKEMLFYTVCSWSLSLFPLFIIIFFTKQNELFSRIILGLWIILVMLLLCAWRALFRKLLVSARRKGYNTRAVGIVGLTKRGIDLANEIIQFPESGFKLIAVFDERSPDRLSVQHKELLAGGIAEGVKMAQEGKIEILYIALPLTDKARIDNILKALGDTTVDVHIVPDIFTFNLLHSRMGHVGKIQTISVYDSPMRGGYSIMKRMEDVFLSLTILSLIAIPMLLIAIAIKLTSKGPVLFKQDRYGIVGKKIKVWKFRTMRVMDNGEVVKQATKNDPRITPIGAFLRRTSLDELPQFFNVLQGTMSVVGPRPHAVSHNEEYRKKVAYYMLRHKMKPGITGWAQVNGWRGETDTVDKMEMRIKYDLDYIRNWSIWMDFKIVVFTLLRGFVGKNVY